jgi:hypothetical protein
MFRARRITGDGDILVKLPSVLFLQCLQSHGRIEGTGSSGDSSVVGHEAIHAFFCDFNCLPAALVGE